MRKRAGSFWNSQYTTVGSYVDFENDSFCTAFNGGVFTPSGTTYWYSTVHGWYNGTYSGEWDTWLWGGCTNLGQRFYAQYGYGFGS